MFLNIELADLPEDVLRVVVEAVVRVEAPTTATVPRLVSGAQAFRRSSD